jgi:hypothetical protein
VSCLGVLVARYPKLLLNDVVFYCSFTSTYAAGYNVLASSGVTHARVQSSSAPIRLANDAAASAVLPGGRQARRMGAELYS